MPRFETSTHVDGPPQRVFEQITDLAGAPQRISGIKRLEVLTEGPVGKGTRWRETRVMFGREATEEMEITDFRPGESYTCEAENCGCLYRCTLAVAPEGGGSRLSASLEATPTTFMARLMSALTMPLMRKAVVKAFDKDLADIKASVESGGAGARSPAEAGRTQSGMGG
ncbi:MAG TPA: SRPBCC family protein [Phycisphaerales bacterium]|nr:SRPBCC family protein [Phycisphaerales bacterium]